MGQIEDRERLLLAILEESESEQKFMLKKDFNDKKFETVKGYILDRQKGKELDGFPDFDGRV